MMIIFISLNKQQQRRLLASVVWKIKYNAEVEKQVLKKNERKSKIKMQEKKLERKKKRRSISSPAQTQAEIEQ